MTSDRRCPTRWPRSTTVAGRPAARARPPATAAAAAASAHRSGPSGAPAGGIGAVGVKELRGRMRGRRAFVILSLYLVLLGRLRLDGRADHGADLRDRLRRQRDVRDGRRSARASSRRADARDAARSRSSPRWRRPASISLEREKQTLEMLAATPITSLAIVLGKLLSALIYVWLLIAASIPLTAVVFVFGGVAPDDLLRGYLVLIVTALGLGAFGLFCSSLVKRTQAAIGDHVFGVLALSIGLALRASCSGRRSPAPTRVAGPARSRARRRRRSIFLNPFLAQADVAPTDALCGTDLGAALLLPVQARRSCSTRTGSIFVNGSARNRAGPDRHRRWRPASGRDRPRARGPRRPSRSEAPDRWHRQAAASPATAWSSIGGGPVPFEVVDAGIWEKTVDRLVPAVDRVPAAVRPVRLTDPSLAPATRCADAARAYA